MSRLEDHLVLNRYFHHHLGAESFEDLKGILRDVPEGRADDGQTHFFGRLVTQTGLKVPKADLERYDRRVLNYEEMLAKARLDFRGFRYFQYLSLLYLEMFLDRLTADPAALLADLNTFLAGVREAEPELAVFPDFVADDLRRLAYFMATGSGKTLLFHINVWQLLHYLEYGEHSEALVRRSDGRPEFDNILLITPNEGLSHQHIEELRLSGVDADHFLDDPHGRGSLFGPKVKVIEIHKLAEEPSRDGVSVVLDELGGRNLVFVDEGHKGTSTEARVWKIRQQRLSADGFLVEYSATFAQAIGAAGRRVQEQLLGEYGKAILFDYSYAHFYGDGYGKNFDVLNLSKARASQAHELLVGGLLTYYHQVVLCEKHAAEYRPYNVERPLWVMLGSSVNAMYTADKKRRSDVAEVVAFLKAFLEDPKWAVKTIGRILEGTSGFKDEAGNDLFAPHIAYLRKRQPDALYKAIYKEVFHGAGALEVWEIKNAEGELGLRVSTGGKSDAAYFGVINIGDVPAFKCYLQEHVGIDVQEDRFACSQFEQVNRPDSATNILIGAKKFIEGWSSWRVSSMSLLNVGKGEGPQVIQLFGRGVRLKGKSMSLKRSEALGEVGHPEGIKHLETLYIFGWNADYIRTFREMLEQEDVGKEFMIPVKYHSPWPKDDLPVPKKKENFDAGTLTWTLAAEKPNVLLDLTPRVVSLIAAGQAPVVVTGSAAQVAEVSFQEAKYAGVLDQGRLFTEVVGYKQHRGYHNVFIPRSAPMSILADCCTLRMPADDTRDPEVIQDAAQQLLKIYLDRFVRRKEREAESQHVVVGVLEPSDVGLTRNYRVRVHRNGFLKKIEKLLEKPLQDMDDAEPLPRLYVDWHLFNPVLTEGGKVWKKEVSVRPPALVPWEAELVRDLRQAWRGNHDKAPFVDYKVYLLRNLPRVGVGLFQRSGFYPDFILWLKHTKTGAVHVRFIDPHGLHHGGLAGSEDKFEAMRKLANLSLQADFKKKQTTLDGFILAKTPIEQIPDAGGRDWPSLEKQYPLVRQVDQYAKRLLTPS